MRNIVYLVRKDVLMSYPYLLMMLPIRQACTFTENFNRCRPSERNEEPLFAKRFSFHNEV
ncbi:hypothetical protein QWJ34_18860 [Saccharibacillus sp. CPCC 101409]|uniref:hypothetical protein n=1 Tax=Saccharibacillus sp. CPCC 101409 TaxID=3058041 RepID=UPI00267405F3|nr:hypothetical protein [Saccharibacillus sp. CPCC 101409]MDO3411830.1 hypothetical protein [Saccharibacillus sp. CPCC 101409]